MSAPGVLLLVPSQLERARLHRPRAAGVELLACGIGVAEAGASVARRLAAGSVRCCVLVGLAGTRDSRLAPIGALVSGSAVRNEAVGAGHGAAFLGLAEMGLPEGESPPDVLPLAPELLASLRDDPLRSGVIGTVAAASGSPAEAAAWHARHPDVLVEEMEGYAVALACRQAGVPLAILRAVSNAAGDRDHRRWDVAGALATLSAALDRALAAAGAA